MKVNNTRDFDIEENRINGKTPGPSPVNNPLRERESLTTVYNTQTDRHDSTFFFQADPLLQRTLLAS